VDRSLLIKRVAYLALVDELEKICATVLMKPLSSAAKSFMERTTNFAAGHSIPQVAGARQLRHALTVAPGAPELMTEMHGMGKLLKPGERTAKEQAKKHYEGVLARQGRVYKGTPGMEQELATIGGHPRVATRTGAEVGSAFEIPKGTVAASPKSLRSAFAPTQMAPVNPLGATVMA